MNSPKIDKALAELKDEGVLDKIKSYYIEGNTDTVPYESPKDIKYDGELHMATNAAFPPYEYVEGGKIVGLDPMMATAICDKLGKNLLLMIWNLILLSLLFRPAKTISVWQV